MGVPEKHVSHIVDVRHLHGPEGGGVGLVTGNGVTGIRAAGIYDVVHGDVITLAFPVNGLPSPCQHTALVPLDRSDGEVEL